MKYQTDDLRINEIKTITPPAVLCEEIPVSEKAAKTTYETRQAIHSILSGDDDRLVVITGPCSIHDIKSAIEYASRLKPLIDKYSDDLLIIMRVYFEKPRTTVGWKGLINDPNLDGSFEINQGLRLARGLLHDLNESGIAAATEYLDLITPQYVSDLIGWGAIGARTTESQAHRELASGLSCPVGFKNGTDGTTKIAVDAIGAALCPHHFLSLRKEGNSGIFSTTGNPDCHIILRGGKEPNYDAASVNKVSAELEKAGLPANIMIDFSHANSNKQYEKQMDVGTDVCNQLAAGDNRIFGVMIESHLIAGRQDIVVGKKLTYGQSITDACLGWEDTEILIDQLAKAVQKRRS
ncbi:MAG: 3-deoxy-7-phosphoheptulonate synthase AroG [Gammaproteobacteria bacterium]|nr:3-deoxy-7-phosphoheptulonate synthase AroG [Gammaproteobacteria bacterium]